VRKTIKLPSLNVKPRIENQIKQMLVETQVIDQSNLLSIDQK